MNHRFVVNQLGLLLLALAVGFVGLAIFGLAQYRFFDGGANEIASAAAMGISAVVGAIIGGGCRFATRGCTRRLGRREALLLVGLTWVIGGALAALPYRLWSELHRGLSADHPFHSFADCYFESISGLTTTGATVLSAIGELPASLLLWRSITHWLGGLGIVVLFVAVLPSLGTGGKRLFRVEAPGPRHEGVKPHIGETSRILWLLYLGLTAACLIGYRVFGMSWFDATCHAFSTLSTGGLSTRDASLGHWNSLGIDLVAMVFMLAAGLNFALYYHATKGRWKPIWRDVELRVYLISKLGVILLLMPGLMGRTIQLTNGETVEGTFGTALRHASFATASMHTGTGFGIGDYEAWSTLSQILLVGLMFIGGCAGSTAGGIKVVRFWVAIKIMAAELEKAFRPDVVRPLRVGGATIDPQMKIAVLTFLIGFVVVLIGGAAAIGLLESGDERADVTTSLTASLACIANVGPGLGFVGPTDNFGWFSGPSKYVLSLLMVLGRLEFFAIVVLFTPRFWRGD
ncbi:MAG: TrkH family potassium uptake protein [Phycisphaerales bacterium]